MKKAISFFLLLIILSCSVKTTSKILDSAQKAINKGKLEEAFKTCKTVLQKDSLNTRAINIKAMVLQAKMDIAQSKKLYYKSLKIDSNQVVPWELLANIYMHESGVMNYKDTMYINGNQLDSAIKCFTKAIDLDSTQGYLFYQRSFCYHFKGNSTLSNEDIEKACKLKYRSACSYLKNQK